MIGCGFLLCDAPSRDMNPQMSQMDADWEETKTLPRSSVFLIEQRQN